MADFELFLDEGAGWHLIGQVRSQRARGKELLLFEYAESWLLAKDRFQLEPALPLTRGAFAPGDGRAVHGSIGDSAPDTWGRRLMQRAERRRANQEGRSVRTLMESDYLLGVADETRLGALRFRPAGGTAFVAPLSAGVPSLIDLGRLLESTHRILCDEDTDEDLQLVFAPGSSLGGARPKASVRDAQGRLSIAKFPKEEDDYSLETWEAVALTLATRAGIATAPHQLLKVAGRGVLLSRRFDRKEGGRIPFLSAMALMGALDGESASYPEMVEVMAAAGAQATQDAHQLFRRMVFHVMVSNVDDHLRNHGFLRHDSRGWTLSPAYDLNPVPTDVKARILTTRITPDEATCSLDLVEEAAGFFALSLPEARRIIREVATATAEWRVVARNHGLRKAEIDRMASAFEHEDSRRALTRG